MHAQMDVPFQGGTIRVSGHTNELSVSILDGDWETTGHVRTEEPDDLRTLARALNQVADFIEGKNG